ncbi:MAG: two pore domain potassium channel family protein [Actinobacteria bacterium]|jgi:voltage-gated potassium channel|nr:MAG: two pore domain potassium channel family protein [Actinomycetota bacterium]
MTTLVPGLRLVERRLTRFLREPVSIRNALSVIVGGTLAIMVLAALLMRTVDHREYRSLGRALWWSVQTVTTVGYGDVTPRFASGRIVAAAVMLWGVAFLAILTAAITSTFVARAARERTNVGAFEAASAADRIDEQLVDLALRLDRMEDTLSRLAGG